MKPFAEYLKKQFEARSKKNSSYSMRAFARDMGVGASTLNRIVNGKLEPSLDLIAKLIQSLGLSSLQESRALAQFTSGVKPAKEIEDKYQTYSEEASLEQDSWEYSAILESFNLDPEPVTIAVIAKVTGISSQKVDERVRVLEKLGLLVRTQKGWRTPSQRNLTTRERQESVRKVIKDYFDLAILSMNEDPKEKRRIAGITAAIDPDRLPEAFEMMHEFQLQLMDFLTSGKRKEIYRLNLSLAPVKRLGKKEAPAK